MSTVKIIDNFLDKESFKHLQSFLLGYDFAWHYNDFVDFRNEKTDSFMFTHTFYRWNEPCSAYYNLLEPIIDKLDAYNLVRIKANLLTRATKPKTNVYHVDEPFKYSSSSKWTTAIFYMNTNNGYTKFENGTKVNSVANRLITFPMDMAHTGTYCTDEKTRVVINFNYCRA